MNVNNTYNFLLYTLMHSKCFETILLVKNDNTIQYCL